MEIIGYILSLFIGISLGLIGSGGSILAIPILVYFFKLTPEHATTHSLFIVGTTSAIAAFKHYKQGNLKLQQAITFSIPSIISLLLTRKYILPAIPEIIVSLPRFTISKHLVMMVFFSILMMMASISMIRRKNNAHINPKPAPGHLVVLGVIVGIITGFLGAGGGFLIVPALLFYAGISLSHAIATSLFIITINSLSGFVGDLVNQVSFDKRILITVSGVAMIGMFMGLFLARKMNGKKLKPLFGYFILLMGLFILGKELFFPDHR